MRLTIKEMETFGSIYSKLTSISSKRFCAVSEAATLTSVCCVLAVLDALIRYTADLVSLDTALTSTRRTNNVGCYYNTYC